MGSISVRKGQSDAFICRFNPNEAPAPRPFSGRPGHWQANDGGFADEVYLDVNICDDGSFSGIWQNYFCSVPGLICLLIEDSPQFPVSGRIDFQNWSGTITLGDDIKDIPLNITRQEDDLLLFHFDPDTPSDDFPAGFRFFLYYKGECEAGACKETTPIPPSHGNSGGGKSGCFLNSMRTTLIY